MGLLDFLSSKPATNNSGQGGLVVTPPTSQNYTNTQQDHGPVIQKSYKDVQYPMPGSTDTQLGATSIPEANGLQPKLNYATAPLTPVSPLPTTSDLPHVETILDNGVRQVNHSNDVLPTVNSFQQTPQYSYSSNPVPADVILEQAQADAELEEKPIEQTQTITETTVGNPLPSEVPGISVTQPTPEQQVPEQTADESHNGDIIEIGSAANNPVSDESQESIIPETPVAAPQVEEVVTETLSEVPTVETTTTTIEPLVETQPPVTQTVTEVTQPIEPVSSEEVVTEEQLPIPPVTEVTETVEPLPEVPTPGLPPITEITPVIPVEDKPIETAPITEVTKIEPENKIETEALDLNVLNKVAFVSLNSQSVNSSLSKKIKSLAEVLNPMIKEVFIDSNKGYGMDIISGLNGSKLKVTAAYLKPFFSKYSDETNLDVPIENLTRITFSTVLDRIKYLYREATVFIIPETSGLNSLSQVALLLNSQSMYFGTHKPVILFGTAWKDRISTLKASFALSEQEVNSMYFASTPDEVVSILKKLDEEFSSKNIRSNDVIDMRDEQGEKEGLLSA